MPYRSLRPCFFALMEGGCKLKGGRRDGGVQNGNMLATLIFCGRRSILAGFSGSLKDFFKRNFFSKKEVGSYCQII